MGSVFQSQFLLFILDGLGQAIPSVALERKLDHQRTILLPTSPLRRKRTATKN